MAGGEHVAVDVQAALVALSDLGASQHLLRMAAGAAAELLPEPLHQEHVGPLSRNDTKTR